MRFLFVSFAAAVAACSPRSESVEPEPPRRELGLGQFVTRTVPLNWHASEHWTIEPHFGAAVRSNPCGQPEPILRPLSIEVDAATVPDGVYVVGGTITIAPCPARGPNLPDNLPAFNFQAIDRFGQPVASSAGAQDASADVVAFSTMHEIEIPTDGIGGPLLLNREKQRLVAMFEGEHGDDAVGGARVLGVTVTYLSP